MERAPNAWTGISASDHARLHLGNNHTNVANHYTIRQRRSDDTLTEDARNRRFLKAAAEGQVRRLEHLHRLGADIDYSDGHGFTALHHAVVGDPEDTGETVGVLLQAGADVNAESVDLGTPLVVASMLGRSNNVQVLLGHRAHTGIKIVGRLNGTALHCACMSGQLEIVKALVDRGANMKLVAKTYFKTTLTMDVMLGLFMGEESAECKYFDILESESFMIAVEFGFIHLYQYFMERGSSLQQTCLTNSWDIVGPSFHQGKLRHEVIQNYTALMAASSSGNPELVKSLMGRGMVIDHQDSTGRTALIYAVLNGSVDCLRTLLVAGASLLLRDTRQRTALNLAAVLGQTDCLRILLEQPTCKNIINAQDEGGWSALHGAVINGNAICVRLLLENGADSYVPRDNDTQTPVMYAIRADAADCLHALLEHDNYITRYADMTGATILHVAAGYGSPKCAAIILEKGGALDAVNRDDRTPLMTAALYGREVCMQLLVSHPSFDRVLNMQDAISRTALHWAARRGNIGCVKMLVEAGAAVDTVDYHGVSPLETAHKKGHGEIVRLLASHGAKIDGDLRQKYGIK